MPNNSNTGRLTRLRDAFGQLREDDVKALLLQSEAFDKYGQEGEDVAVDLLTDQPELADSKEEFWRRLEEGLEHK